MLNVQVTLRYHTVEDGGPRCTSIDKVRQSETPRCQYFQELISEMITIIFQYIILVSGITLAHSRYQYVIDFEGSEFADGNLLTSLRIITILYRYRLFENERCIAARSCYVDSRVSTGRVTAIGKLIPTNLKSAVINSETGGAKNGVASIKVF